MGTTVASLTKVGLYGVAVQLLRCRQLAQSVLLPRLHASLDQNVFDEVLLSSPMISDVAFIFVVWAPPRRVELLHGQKELNNDGEHSSAVAEEDSIAASWPIMSAMDSLLGVPDLCPKLADIQEAVTVRILFDLHLVNAYLMRLI